MYVLDRIDVEPGNPVFVSDDGVLINNQTHTVFCYPPARTNTSYVIPDGITTIGDNAFSGARFLVEISIPSTVETIVRGAFYGCSKVVRLVIPSSVSVIGDQVFDSMYSLKFIEVEQGNEFFESIDGVLFNKQKNVIIRYPPCLTNTSYAIPDGVAQIKFSVFSDCSYLTEVTIPPTVVAIGMFAFSSCKNLTSIAIPASVSYISGSAFSYCSNLNAVFYEGDDILCDSDVFAHCDDLNMVCVSPDYKSSTFCNKNVNSNETCQTYKNMFNICYRGFAKNDGTIIQKKRDNVTEWEKQSNQCFKYECNTENGLQFWRICNSSDSLDRVCVNDQCIEGDDFKDKQWSVKIMLDKVTIYELNISEVVSIIGNLSGVKEQDITTGTEVLDDGTVKSIVLYVDEEETTKKISDAVNGIDKKTNCQYGILCQAKEVIVKKQSSEIHSGDLSCGHHNLLNMFCFVMALLFCFFK